MSSITGLAGLEPTINLIKHTKKLQLQIRVHYLWMETN